MADLLDEQNGALVSLWKTASTITSRVGSDAAARIWADEARARQIEKNNAPYIVYVRGTGTDVHDDLSGSVAALGTIVHVYCWADTRTEADALARAVKTATQNNACRGTWAGLYLNWAFVLDIDSGSDPPIDGSNKKKPWTRIVFRVVHSDS